MARRKVAYRKRHQNRFSMFLVTLVVVMVMAAVALRSVELKQKIEVKLQEQELLLLQIEEERLRTLAIEEFAKEIQTKGFIENIAREKLGLVYEGEILFKQDD